MSRDNKTLLLEKSKNDPKLKELVDSINAMSTEDINNLSNQAKWVRDGLVRIKEESGYKNIEEYVLANCRDIYNEDFVGDIQRWLGDEVFIKFGRTDLLIRPDDLFFITDKGIWIDTIFTTTPDKALNPKVNFSLVKRCKFTEYKDEVKRAINSRHKIVEDALDKPMWTTKSWTSEYPP